MTPPKSRAEIARTAAEDIATPYGPLVVQYATRRITRALDQYAGKVNDELEAAYTYIDNALTGLATRGEADSPLVRDLVAAIGIIHKARIPKG